jgi:hypothetical protein
MTLAFLDSAQSEQPPLFNVHEESLVAIVLWQADGAQVHIDATDYTSTNLSEDEPPPHRATSFISVCAELPTRRICGGSYLLDDQLVVDGNLGSAVLKAVVPAQECLLAPCTCRDSNLYIDLVWTATGPLDHSVRWHNKHFEPEPCHIMELGRITRRQAQVTGSIAEGTVNLIEGLDTVFAGVEKFRAEIVGPGDPEVCL